MSNQTGHVANQHITEKYALYQGDCMHVLPTLPSESVDLMVYSPPFAVKGTGGLYRYSSSEHDLSNCETQDQFFEQYRFIVSELARITKPGCIHAVHCMDIHNPKTEGIWDFPNEIIRLYEAHGFELKNRITVWKEPLKVRLRLMLRSLMHVNIVEDSTKCFPATPDQVLVFEKNGERAVKVTHPMGLTHYAGATPLLPEHLGDIGLPLSMFDVGSYKNFEAFHDDYMWKSFDALKKQYEGHEKHLTNKFSQLIWQRYASSVWDDVRIDHVLPFRDAREDDDEKHVHPLQLDVIDRCVELWSNPGEVVLSPFMGVGSEIFSPVSMGRFAIGIELKPTYFKQAVKNCEEAVRRFEKSQVQKEIKFDVFEMEGV